MSLTRVFIVSLAILFSLTLAGLSFADEPGYVISIQFENDFFGGGTDRHFSHGTRIECLTKPKAWITDAADRLPWFSSEMEKSTSRDALEGRACLSIGQNIYTPEDTFQTQLIPEDRPYAGWLYLGFGLMANQGDWCYDKLQLEIGMVGPYSFAKEVQNYWHSLLGLHVPKGWGNQLDSEPGAVLYYERALRIDEKKDVFGLKSDVIPHIGGSVGNVFTYAAAGVTVRLGLNLDDDFGPPRIRPSLPGGGYFGPKNGFNWYFFTGLEGRAVLYNIFLDGNIFSDSHSVDKKPFTGDIQAGLAVQWERFRFSYTQVFRTKEFKGQDCADLFGSLSLSYQF